MSPDVQLRVDGQRYGGWKQISIDRGIETACNGFELSVTERWAGQDTVRPIRPGVSCEIAIDGEVIITGYVDDVAISHSATDHTVTVRGRDRTGDLVDCSAVHQTGAWSKVSLAQIATDVARPFGVSVVVETDIGAPFPQWQIQEGETAFECIERAARMRGVLITSNASGALVLSRAGTTHTGATIALGKNLLGASGTFTTRDRFSNYLVKGAMPGTDLTSPEQHASPVASIADEGVSRYRPLVVVAEDNGDPAVLAARATWECNVRYGRAARIDALVQGWRAGQALWTPNRLVRYQDSFMGLDGDLLIASARLTLDGEGFTTQLSLTRREAFDVEPLPRKKVRRSKAKSGAVQFEGGDLDWAWQ